MQNYKLKFKNNVVVMKALIVLSVVAGTCWAGGCTGNLVGCEAKECKKQMLIRLRLFWKS